MGIGESDEQPRRTALDMIAEGGISGEYLFFDTGAYEGQIYHVIKPECVLRKGRDTFSLSVRIVGEDKPIYHFNPWDKEAYPAEVDAARNQPAPPKRKSK